MPKPVRSQFGRHSIKKAGTKTGLSRPGIRLARLVGKRIPKRWMVKGYHSPVIRAESTVRLMLRSHQKSGGKAYPVIRPKKELGLSYIVNPAACDRLEAKLGEKTFLRRWLNGKISERLIHHPHRVADAIIRRRFGLGQRIARLGFKDKLLKSVSHAWQIEAVFERLTGTRYDALPPGTQARPTEAMEVIHYQNGKAILTYRGKRFDVTKRLDQIVRAATQR